MLPKRPSHGMSCSRPFPAFSLFPKAGPLALGTLLLWALAAPLGHDGGRAAAQESNQASLVSVEKAAQAHLLEPRNTSLSIPAEPPTRTRQQSLADQPLVEPGLQNAPLDISRTRLTIAWGYFNHGDYEKALAIFQSLVQKETAPDVAEESRLGLAYSLRRLHRLPETAGLLEELVNQGIRPKETVPALIEVLLALKRYEDAEKYLPLLP